MPRFSGAYTAPEDWVIRGGVGLFYDKPEGNVIFSQMNLPPFVAERQRRERESREPARRRRGRRPTVLGDITALDPNMDVPRQLHYSFGVQRELPHGHFAEVTYVGNQGRHLLWQPEHQHSDVRGGAARMRCCRAPRPVTNYLRPYKGYSNITQRRSDAFSDYNSLQIYLNKRRGDFRYSVSYTLGKATGSAAATATTRWTTRAGDRPITSTRPTSSARPRSIGGTRCVIIPTYTPPYPA